jgi:hypothetical protein
VQAPQAGVLQRPEQFGQPAFRRVLRSAAHGSLNAGEVGHVFSLISDA